MLSPSFGRPKSSEKEQFEKNVDRMFKGGCGVYFYSLMVEDKVTNKKLPWLKEGSEFLVVTATMSFSNISLRRKPGWDAIPHGSPPHPARRSPEPGLRSARGAGT